MTVTEAFPRRRNAPADAIPFVFNDSDGNLYEGYTVDVHHGDNITCLTWGGFAYVDGVEHVAGQPYDDQEAKTDYDADEVHIPAESIDYIEVF